MRKVLISWEKGKGLGHISRILSTARHLKELNCSVVLSIPKEYTTEENLKSSGLRLVNIIDDVPNAQAGHDVLSFASMLYFFGLGDKSYLLKAVGHYRDFFVSNQVSCVLLDYSPVVQLACYIFGFKAVQITDGFCCAPPNFPMFLGVNDTSDNDHKNRQVINLLNNNIKELGLLLKGSDRYNLFDYVNYPSKYYDTIPELDFYGQCTIENSLGPLVGLSHKSEITFKNKISNLKVFCYLRQATSENMEILRYLERKDIQAVCVYPDATDSLSEFNNSSVVITREPVDLNELLEQCTHVISYGATGTLSKAILKGRPQFIVAADTQKQMVTSKALLIGVVSIHQRDQALDTQLDQFLSNQTVIQQSQMFSLKYRDHDFSKTMQAFINELAT